MTQIMRGRLGVHICWLLCTISVIYLKNTHQETGRERWRQGGREAGREGGREGMEGGS